MDGALGEQGPPFPLFVSLFNQLFSTFPFSLFGLFFFTSLTLSLLKFDMRILNKKKKRLKEARPLLYYSVVHFYFHSICLVVMFV